MEDSITVDAKKIALDEDVLQGFINCRVTDAVASATLFSREDGKQLFGAKLQNIDDRAVKAEADLIDLLAVARREAEAQASKRDECDNKNKSCYNEDGTLDVLSYNSPLLGLGIAVAGQGSEKYGDDHPLCTSVIAQARHYGYKTEVSATRF